MQQNREANVSFVRLLFKEFRLGFGSGSGIMPSVQMMKVCLNDVHKVTTDEPKVNMDKGKSAHSISGINGF